MNCVLHALCEAVLHAENWLDWVCYVNPPSSHLSEQFWKLTYCTKHAGCKDHPTLWAFSLCNLLRSIEQLVLYDYKSSGAGTCFAQLAYMVFLVHPFWNTFLGHQYSIMLKEHGIFEDKELWFSHFLAFWLGYYITRHTSVQWEGLSYGSSMSLKYHVRPWVELAYWIEHYHGLCYLRHGCGYTA